MEQSIQKVGEVRFSAICGKYGFWVFVSLLVVVFVIGLITTVSREPNVSVTAVCVTTAVLLVILIMVRYWVCTYKNNETAKFIFGWRTLQGK